uniref:Reverse transcriptase n=1 Tax=Cannabis sativa TaxID=3483 RepID=A0A803QSS3_CANSA
LFEIAIEEESEGGLDLEELGPREEEEFVYDWRLCLVGGFITAGAVDFLSMQQTPVALWKPGKGVYIKELDANRFLFQFFHKIDIKRVIEGSPWYFNRKALIISRMKNKSNPRCITLVGNYMGAFVESCPNNFMGIWRDYMRIRVTIDLSKPLKRQMRLRKLSEEWFWITFKYENVPTFCFICGMSGHSERFCAKLFNTSANEITKPYGEWMKAPLRRRKKLIGAQWLRTGFESMDASCNSNQKPDHPTQNRGSNGAVIEQNYQNNSKMAMDRGKNHMIDTHIDGGISQLNNSLQHVFDELANNQPITKKGKLIVESKKRRSNSELGQSVAMCIENEVGLVSDDEDVEKVEGLKFAIGFEGSFTVGSQGHGGGIAVLWRNKEEVEIKSYSTNYIDMIITTPEWPQFRLTGIYGEPNRSKRKLITDLANIINLPWCLIGDMNNVTCQSDKKGGRPYPNWLIDGFQNVFSRCNLIDMEMEGYKFTWERGKVKIEKCSEVLAEWGKEITGSFKTKISKCEKRIKLLKGMRDADSAKRYQEENERLAEIKRNNQINNLRDDLGSMVGWDNGLQDVMVGYFKQLFTSSTTNWNQVIDCIPTTITQSQNSEILAHVEEGEVKKALFQMHPNKSPGPDGMSPGFYQKYWDIVSYDVIQLVRDFFLRGDFPNHLPNTNIVLVPKKKQPTSMAEIRPISLCNVLYKVVSKVLANIIKAVLHQVISETQSAFIPNRLITDNIMVAFEIMHYMKRKMVGRNGVMALKFDMSKAYDRVEWGYLRAVLTKMGANEREATNVLSLLNVFEQASGQKINHDKSSIFFSRNTDVQTRDAICGDMGIHEVDKNGTYLGLPNIIGRKKSAIQGFLKEKVQKRIQSWDGKLLSKAGKEILLKTIAQALPNYAMSVFLLPIETSREIERAMCKYWWSSSCKKDKNIHWMSWDRMCKPKMKGGLGFCNLYDFNVSLFGKQGWRLLIQPQSLVSRLFKAKYFPNSSFLSAEIGGSPSFVWRSLMEAQQLVKQGAAIRVGSGATVSILNDPWLPDAADPYVHTFLKNGVECVDNRFLCSVGLSGSVVLSVTALNQWLYAQDKTFDPSLGLFFSEDGNEHWTLPNVNMIKINTDAAIFSSSNCYSYSCVARTHTSSLLEAKAKCVRGVVSPELAEAIGIHEALSWIKDKKWCRVEVESDCLVASQAIRSSSTIYSYFGRIITKCKRLLDELKDYLVSLKFVKRSTNNGAHYLARSTCFIADRSLSVSNAPSEFISVLMNDLIV